VNDLQILINQSHGRSQRLRPGDVAYRFWIFGDE
jgi:hypothetical protein